MLPPTGLDRVLLGAVAATLALYLGALARSAHRAGGPRWLRLTLTGLLLLLALDVQLAGLLLLLGPDGTQDGLLRGDVRLRNVLGVVASTVVWGTAAMGRIRGRDTTARVLHSGERSDRIGGEP